MKKIIFVSGLAILLAGCNEGQVEDVSAAVETPDPKAQLGNVGDKKDCPGSNGPDIFIRYGDSKIEVTHKVQVKSDGRLVLWLFPTLGPSQEVDHSKTLITLAGKNAKSAWINATLQSPEKSPEKVVICVGERDVDTYEYIVMVSGVGQIDPRVEVIPD